METLMQKDPRYYPNPDTFNPDNFSKEAKAKRNP
jgi:cytochrome P450